MNKNPQKIYLRQDQKCKVGPKRGYQMTLKVIEGTPRLALNSSATGDKLKPGEYATIYEMHELIAENRSFEVELSEEMISEQPQAM